MVQNSNLTATFAQGVESVHAFTISNSAKAFKALSDGIYSDKILAPIRELSTNAYDAHVDKGITDTPIKVTLPSKDNDFMFIVRDFGNGLDHESVCTLYTTYFASSKDTRDDSVGCFGLGSKSPFAYTDSFIVESNQKGLKNLYNCVMSAEGPKLVYVGAIETEDEDGMQISFVVKPSDSYKFQSTAEDFYKYWKSPVHLYLNNKLVDTGFDSSEYNLFTVGDCSVYVTSITKGCRLVMGNVTYALSENMLRDTFAIQKEYRDLLIAGTVIYVPIGKFSVTQSRESLEADDVTLLNLQSLVTDLVSVVCSSYIDEALALDWVGRSFLHSRLPQSFKSLLKTPHFEPLLVDVPDEIKSRGYQYVLNMLKISVPVNPATGLGGIAGMLTSTGKRKNGTSVIMQNVREFKIHELLQVNHIEVIDPKSVLNFVDSKKGFTQKRYSFSAKTHLKDELINTLMLEPGDSFSVGLELHTNLSSNPTWVPLGSYAYSLADSLQLARPIISKTLVELHPVKRDNWHYAPGKKRAKTVQDGVCSRSVGLWKYSNYTQAVRITREDMPYVVVPDAYFESTQANTKCNIVQSFFVDTHKDRNYPFDVSKLCFQTRNTLISTTFGDDGTAFVKESYVGKLPETWVNITDKYVNLFATYLEEFDEQVEFMEHFIRALSWDFTRYNMEYEYVRSTITLCKEIRRMSPVAADMLKNKYGAEIANFLDKACAVRESEFFNLHKELVDFTTAYDSAMDKPTGFIEDLGRILDTPPESFDRIHALILASLDKPSEEEV